MLCLYLRLEPSLVVLESTHPKIANAEKLRFILSWKRFLINFLFQILFQISKSPRFLDGEFGEVCLHFSFILRRGGSENLVTDTSD